jgi:hypothetical protein
MKTELVNYIKSKIAENSEESVYAPNDSQIKDNIYNDILDFIESLDKNKPVEYAVDYDCPARNAFISSVENSI